MNVLLMLLNSKRCLMIRQQDSKGSLENLLWITIMIYVTHPWVLRNTANCEPIGYHSNQSVLVCY